MTRKRRTAKQAQEIKAQLAEIIRDTFDNNGQVITHEWLAQEHVRRNASVSAIEEVMLYGGPAIVHLRRDLNYAIVPITAKFDDLITGQEDEQMIVNAVAGLGAGGSRIGWYHPADKDDWLWVYYIGHLGYAGIKAVFHAAQIVDSNPALISAKGRLQIANRSVDALGSAGKTEVKVLEARLKA
jgi:hypothetical protein